MTKTFARSWLAAVTGMAGRAVDARREFAAIERSPQDAEAGAWDLERFIAEAWTCAAEGAMSQAISIVRDAAAKESERGRPAWEVVLLQTATQFGDHTTAARLAELTEPGPRARAHPPPRPTPPHSRPGAAMHSSTRRANTRRSAIASPPPTPPPTPSSHTKTPGCAARQ